MATPAVVEFPECSDSVPKETLMTWAKYALGAAMIAFILYYAYTQFAANIESYITKDQASEKSNVAADFNLHNAVDNLKKMQATILNSISF